jgi:hypothetical protein
MLPTPMLYLCSGYAEKLYNQPLDEPLEDMTRLVTHRNQSWAEEASRPLSSYQPIRSYITYL